MTREDRFIETINDFAQWTDRVPVIGLCGKGASGKSKLARTLNALHPGVVDVSMDWWFHQSTDEHRRRIAEARESGNEHWITYCENPFNRIDWVGFARDFEEFRETGALKRERMYNKKTGNLDLSIDVAIPYSAPRMIMLEGLLAHAGPSKNYMDFLVVLDIPSDVLLQRRLKRESHRKTEQQIRERHALDEHYITPYYDGVVEGPRLIKLNVDELEGLHARFREMPVKPLATASTRNNAEQFAL